MSFAGVSFIRGGGLSSRSTPAATAAVVTDSGYYFLVVDGYSRTKETTTNGKWIESLPFRVGGHRWRIQYSPNGRNPEVADYISLHLLLDDDNVAEAVKVQFKFSMVDKADEKQMPSNIHGTLVYEFSTEGMCLGYRRFIKREDLEKSTHLKDDSLTIKCDIVVIKDVHLDTTGANTAPLVVVPASDMHQHLNSLLESAEGSNVTFEIGGEIFAAHRCVLACRSTIFKELLFGSMNQDTTAAGVLRIDDMEAWVLRLLLRFVYSDSVPENMEEEEGDVMWQHLLVAADRYDLLRLRLICEQKLCTYINTSTVATILALAERHHAQGLKDACLDFLIRDQANLQELMVLGGLDHLASTCPLVLKELIAKLVSSKKAKIDVDAAFVVVPTSDMHQHFTRLLQSGEGTDVAFEVSGEKIHAHRCVLAARSSVFRAELFGPMKEGTTTGVIRIDDMEAKVFKLLLTFIYSDSMPDINEDEDEHDEEEDMEEEDEDEHEDKHDDEDDMEEEEDEDEDEHDDEEDTKEEDEDVDDLVVMWQHLLVAADRYDLGRLRLMCEDKLCGYINATRVASILELAEQHHCRGLKEACLDFLNSHNLEKVMVAGGLNHLRSSCPCVLIDLIAKLAYLKPHN